MKSFLVAMCVSALAGCASASVFMPYTAQTKASSASSRSAFSVAQKSAARDLRLALRQHQKTSASSSTAMAIPGYGIAEQVFVGGFSTFLSLYNLIITARILLSWFPQAASVGALQPVYAITDPYLNLFRGLIPPIFGLDLSPLLAFFLLSVMTNATAAVGAEMPPSNSGIRMPPSVFGARQTNNKDIVLRNLLKRTRNGSKIASMHQ